MLSKHKMYKQKIDTVESRKSRLPTKFENLRNQFKKSACQI